MTFRNIKGTTIAGLSCDVDADNLSGWKKLTPDELRVAQIEILNSFADFCAANGLRYFLYAGTLLGAVRHKGYIPWDDDIDVAMPRRDYDRLHSIARKQAAINSFTLCSPSTIPGFPWPFAKIADNPRTLAIEGGSDVNYQIGINIDVFPLDGWPSGSVARWVHHQSLRILRALMLSHQTPRKFSRSNIRESLLVLAKPIVRRISLQWLIRKTSSRASRYSAEDSSLLGVVVWGNSECVPARVYSQVIDLPFEERQYRAPADYDTVLSSKYGDYYQLPPLELQIAHHSIEAFRLT
jgi:lipopolysaccharide cholinephosphotransferase